MKMNTSITIAVAAMLTCAVVAPQLANAQEAVTTEAAAPAEAKAVEGQLLYAKGKRLAAVYRVNEDGSAQVILDRKMYVVPASTLSSENGKLTTSLSKGEVIRGAS